MGGGGLAALESPTRCWGSRIRELSWSRLPVELAVGIEFVEKQLELVLDAEHAYRVGVLGYIRGSIILLLPVGLFDLFRRLCQSLEELLSGIRCGVIPESLDDFHDCLLRLSIQEQLALASRCIWSGPLSFCPFL